MSTAPQTTDSDRPVLDWIRDHLDGSDDRRQERQARLRVAFGEMVNFLASVSETLREAAEAAGRDPQQAALELFWNILAKDYADDLQAALRADAAQEWTGIDRPAVRAVLEALDGPMVFLWLQMDAFEAAYRHSRKGRIRLFSLAPLPHLLPEPDHEPPSEAVTVIHHTPGAIRPPVPPPSRAPKTPGILDRLRGTEPEPDSADRARQRLGNQVNRDRQMTNAAPDSPEPDPLGMDEEPWPDPTGLPSPPPSLTGLTTLVPDVIGGEG